MARMQNNKTHDEHVRYTKDIHTIILHTVIRNGKLMNEQK